MKLSHQTLRDETLTHQVVFIASSHKFLNIQVSCNCLYIKATHKYDTMGATRNLEESRQLYNDPSNHRAPFTEADKAKW